jgi:hypothetical protein
MDCVFAPTDQIHPAPIMENLHHVQVMHDTCWDSHVAMEQHTRQQHICVWFGTASLGSNFFLRLLQHRTQVNHVSANTTTPTTSQSHLPTPPRSALHQAGLANTNIAKVYIHVVFHCRRQKPRRRHDLRSPPPPTTRPAAVVIFDRRRHL